jgi:CBS domain-containing protein
MLVVRDGRVTGSVSEQAIGAFLGSEQDPESALDRPIDPLVEYYPVFVSPSISAVDAARTFSEHGVDMLPVVDEHGGLRGVLYRSDVIGLLTRNLRPPSVGGMATPLGVYLTTGSISGGAGSIGLYLTGISLGLMMIASKLLGDRVMTVLQGLVMHKLPVMARAWVSYDMFSLGSAGLSIVLMLLLLRLSPLAGYHAAEHMTVHAIESGDDLTAEAVRRYPRVHPRCGTNLLGAVSIFILITSEFSGEIAAMVAIAVVMLGRRAIGDWMQTVFTTKPPNDRQLANGIAAGDEVLRRFHDHPSYQARGFARVWNMGFLQAAAGMSTVLTIVYIVEKLSHRSLLF